MVRGRDAEVSWTDRSQAKSKRAGTKDEANVTIKIAKSDRFKTDVERYSKTETRDMYAFGLSAEILNRACIEKGFSPVGAGRAINTLMRQ